MPSALQIAFEERFVRSRSKGVDRLSGRQYQPRLSAELPVISAKCLSGRFRFSPYLENLKPRGRGRTPRLISIPTVRDRIVLHQLNKYLAANFPECVSRNIASVYVREVAGRLRSADPSVSFVCGCDIKNFYDSIPRPRLINVLRERIANPSAISLVAHAIATPTIPKSARRATHSSFRTSRGIPQGLAISNVLAAISLYEVDRAMAMLPITYYRYVDDILMYGAESDVRRARASLAGRLRYRGLSLHGANSGKSHLGPLSAPFGYLGYEFEWPKITVRRSTIERLLEAIAAKFSEYMHTANEKLSLNPGLNAIQLRRAFLLELNEKITGSVSQNRKYGWIAYFNQINDMELLHKLDRVVTKMFERSVDFGFSAPAELKKFRRAYFEMKFNADGNYVQNYDKITSVSQMRTFLVDRGQMEAGANLSDEAIAFRFDSYRRYILRTMQADEGAMYG